MHLRHRGVSERNQPSFEAGAADFENVAGAIIRHRQDAADAGPVGQSRVERELIEGLFSHGLVDVGRHVDPDNDRLFTWWAPWRNLRQRNIGWRLDYIAAHHALVDGTTTCRSYREVGTSDHEPVIAHLRDEPLS